MTSNILLKASLDHSFRMPRSRCSKDDRRSRQNEGELLLVKLDNGPPVLSCCELPLKWIRRLVQMRRTGGKFRKPPHHTRTPVPTCVIPFLPGVLLLPRSQETLNARS